MKRVTKPTSLAVMVLVVLTACATGGTTKVNGIEVYKKYWNNTLQELRARVAFDLNCPAERADFILFKRVGRLPSEVGATACGKRAMYVRSVVQGHTGPWVFNVGSDTVPASPEASAKPASLPPWSEQQAVH
jgi:hypothetical protein